MTLAAIVGVCLLTASPSVPARAAGHALAAAMQEEFTPSRQPDSESGEANPEAPSTEEQQNTSSASSSQEKSPTPDAQAPPESSPKSGAAQPQEKRNSSPAAKPNPATPKGKSAHSGKTRKRSRKPSATAEKPAAPPKVVIKDGGATDPTITISPGLNQQQASRQRQSAEQLLARADENLKKVSGQNLNSNQQEMVQQIQQYMQQAKAAGNTGDLTRQHNLALKAQLLSEELVKP